MLGVDVFVALSQKRGIEMEWNVETKTGKMKKINLPTGAYPLQFGGVD